MVISHEGGKFITQNGAFTLMVPASQLSDLTTFSVTGNGSGISEGTNKGEITSTTRKMDVQSRCFK